MDEYFPTFGGATIHDSIYMMMMMMMIICGILMTKLMKKNEGFEQKSMYKVIGSNKTKSRNSCRTPKNNGGGNAFFPFSFLKKKGFVFIIVPF